MTALYLDYLTDGKIDLRKVRKLALLRARHDRDIDILLAANIKHPRNVGLSTVLMWRRRAARPLMMAGARAGTATHTGRLFHHHYMNALDTAQMAERNVARSRG